MSGQPTLGLLLVRSNKITREQLYEALREQRATGARLGDILFAHGWIGEEELTMLLAQQLDLPFIDAKGLEKISPILVDKLPAKVASEYRVVPVKLFKGKLTIAIDDQKTRNYLDEISYLTGTTCIPALAAPGAIRRSIKSHYGIDLPERTDAQPARKQPEGKRAAAPKPEPPRAPEKLEALPVTKTDAAGRDIAVVKNAAGEDQVFLLTEVVDEVEDKPPVLERKPEAPAPVSESDDDETARPVVVAAAPQESPEEIWPEEPDEPTLEVKPSSGPKVAAGPPSKPAPAPKPATDAPPAKGDEEHDNFLAPEARGKEPAWRPKGDRAKSPAPKVVNPPSPAPTPAPAPVAATATAVTLPPPTSVATDAPIPDFDIVRAAEKLFEQTDPVGIAQVIVSFARNLMDRAILFDVSGNPYQVLARAGSFLEDDDRGVGFKATPEELVLLGVIAQSQQPSYGPTPTGEMYERFLRTLGLMKPPQILLYPLVVGKKTQAVLFGGLGSERPPEEFDDLQILFKEAATAWEILLG